MSSQLQEVVVTDAVVQSCYSHALTTEKEEIMGVLIGEFIQVSSSAKIAHVVDSFIMQRSDKRADRVEIQPEQLFLATEWAERRSAEVGRRVKVCGWYHSHPHITPFPSHVDLATQGTYQQLVEKAWVGLIFSVFHTDTKRKSGDCSVHAFASRATPQGGWERIDVSIRVVSASTPLERPLCAFQMLPTLSENLVDECRHALNESCSDVGDALLQAMLSHVFQQQLFKISHGVVIPQVNLLQTTFIPQLTARIAEQQKRLDALAVEESHLDEALERAAMSGKGARRDEVDAPPPKAREGPSIDELLSLS